MFCFLFLILTRFALFFFFNDTATTEIYTFRVLQSDDHSMGVTLRQISGADGPWRVGPNLMAVIPTDTEVELSYGRNAWEILATILTLFGLAAVGGLMLLDRGRMPLPGRALALNFGPLATKQSEAATQSNSAAGPDTDPDIDPEFDPELDEDGSDPADADRDDPADPDRDDDDRDDDVAGTAVPPLQSGA